MGKIVWFATKAIAGGVLSYIAPRGLIAMGVPLDRWIEDIFGRLAVEPVLWVTSIILFGVLFFADHFVRAWQARPARRLPEAPRRQIAAPLQYNNPATASLPRYDDEHRGPAVTDSYELSHCRIDLAEHSEAWSLPDNLPPRMIEFAERIPEDQRADWLRRQAALEEVDRLISYAMRSGSLPIWVAPIDEPERLVAPGALMEVDHATVVSGCYRPPNDRGWLYGRPLFVKRDDWAQFVEDVQRSKGVPSNRRAT